MRALLAKMKAEIGFLVLLVVAVAGCWMYVQMRNARDDRDSLQHAAELLCTAAGQPFAAEGKLARGVACQSRIAALSKFESDTATASAETLTKAMAAHDARQLADNLAARAAAEAARDAAHRMENADAEAERRNLVDREWTAAVNGVAGLRPTLAR